MTVTPDEFAFRPSYPFRGNNALQAATDKKADLLAGLKKTGVTENKIKMNINGAEEYMNEGGGQPNMVYTLDVVVSVNNQDLANKVQEYLIKTKPNGAVSPQATLSDTYRTKLEGEARTKATEDAIRKAEENAKSLGFKVGKVKEVSDGTTFAMYSMSQQQNYDAAAATPLLPGENNLTYSVNVTFFIR